MTLKIKITNNSQYQWSEIVESLSACTMELWGESLLIDEEEADYHFYLDSNLSISFDGYVIYSTKEGHLEIKARERVGLLYGLLDIAQNTVKFGEIIVPDFEERGLMVDAGRKFFSFNWFMKLFPRLYRLKINRLQLHFSDNEGFRIESEKYPQIVSKDHLTKRQVEEMIRYSWLFGIEIVPEFDSPGHLEQILQYFPKYQMTEIENGKEKKLSRALNVTDPKAVEWFEDLIKEYIDLFKKCRYFHLGADEFIDFNHLENYPAMLKSAQQQYGEDASGLEPYIDFTNRMIQVVRDQGYIPRVWNDGFYRKNIVCKNELDKDVEVTYWTRWDPNMATVADYLDRGYRLINFNDNFFYYVLGEAAGYTYPTVDKIKKNWTIVDFPQQQKIEWERLDQVGGCYLAVWSDVIDAQSEEEIVSAILPLLKVISQKIWN